MELKHWSWLIVFVCILINLLGIKWLLLLLIAISFFILGWAIDINCHFFFQFDFILIPFIIYRILSIIYIKHRGGAENCLNYASATDSAAENDPLVKTMKSLGLNLGEQNLRLRPIALFPYLLAISLPPLRPHKNDCSVCCSAARACVLRTLLSLSQHSMAICYFYFAKLNKSHGCCKHQYHCDLIVSHAYTFTHGAPTYTCVVLHT